MHSAIWEHNINLSNKSVDVMGAGYTSVQTVPQLQEICKQVEVYMRSPTWISPLVRTGALTNDLPKGQDVNPRQRQNDFIEADNKRFKSDAEYPLDFRKHIEAEINSLFGMDQEGSGSSKVV